MSEPARETKVRLITFEGCPHADQVRSLLLRWKLPFEEFIQDELPPGHPLQRYSSPSVLIGQELILGTQLPVGSSGCSYDRLDENEFELKLRNKLPPT